MTMCQLQASDRCLREMVHPTDARVIHENSQAETACVKAKEHNEEEVVSDISRAQEWRGIL